jgi:hypothetical protein
VDCSNTEVLVTEEPDRDTESECEVGTLGSLPDLVWDDDLEWVDEEQVTNLGSDFMFNSDENVACSYMAADEEIVV